MTDKVYLDHAATTQLDSDVVKVMTDVIQNDFGNPSSIHSLGRKSRIHVENARKIIAQTLNVSIGEIYFTSSATESNNAAIKSSIKDLGVQRIISSKAEHHCVLNTLLSVQSQVELVFLDLDRDGNIDYSQLKELLENEEKRTLVCLMHVNNEIGTMHDIQSISNLCQEYGALFHTDAVQSLGKFNLDLQDIKVNFLSGTAHKINGPKGCGFIYINSGNSIKPIMLGGSQERNMRAGTENLYGIVGLGKALENWNINRDERIEKIGRIRQLMKDKLRASDKDIKFVGNQDKFFAPHILSVSIPRNDRSDMIMMSLDIAGVCASSGSACSSGAEHDSHVLAAINSDKNRKVVRFSFSYMTTDEDIKVASEKLLALI